MRDDLDHLAVNTTRTLAMDAVEAAPCGHPGTPMALRRFGAPAPWKDLYEHFGFTAEAVARTARTLIEGTS